jgi:hypothetical protein
MESDSVLRYSLRGNHIYILLLGLVHLCLGAYLKVGGSAKQRRLQLAGSVLLMTAASVVIAAFFLEPKVGEDRPVTLIGIVMAVAGVGLHLL